MGKNWLQRAGLLTRRGHSRVAALGKYLWQACGVGVPCSKRGALSLSNAVAMNESSAWRWQGWRQRFHWQAQDGNAGQVVVLEVEDDHRAE